MALLAFFLCAGPSTAAELSATDIVRQADLKMRGTSSYTEITLHIIRPDWTRSMSMKAWTKGDHLALVLVTAPARDKGSASLKRDREMWNWVPRIDRVIKIAPSMLGQSWMGSDFTNDDLINQSSILVDYEHRIVGEALFDGTQTWVIDATPKPEAPVVWGKVRLWIGKDTFNQRKAAYYDEFDELINTLTTWDIKPLGGRQLPTRLEMQPADQPDRKTVLINTDAAFDFDLADDFFSQANMKALRP
jgi:hypothetical protein